MDYKSIYNDLICQAQNRKSKPEKYEMHHILPRSLGGSELPKNIVFLTPREHFIAHRLLPKLLTGEAKNKMCFAAWTMARTRKNIKVTSRVYEKLKKESGERMSKLLKGKKTGSFTNDHRKKLSEASKRRYRDPDERKRASEKRKGQKHSEETKAKLSRIKKGIKPSCKGGMKGKTHSEETKMKMRLAWKKRKNK